jgi:hypothetical protein
VKVNRVELNCRGAESKGGGPVDVPSNCLQKKTA